MERQNRESSPPLWRRPQRTASFPSVPGLRQWALVLLFSIFVLLFLPSFLSKGLRPAAGGLIKNGWDALNFLLVLSAILCGLLSRSTNSDDSPTASSSQQWLPSPSPRRSTPVQTPRFGDDYLSQIPAFGESRQTTPVNRRLRSSSSYPDLRHDWLPAEECRFYDDMYLERRLPETRSTMATPRHTFSQVERSPTNSISQDKKIINETVTENQSPIGRPLRSSSSYTDLRKEWVPADEWRFSDDIQLHRRQPEGGSPEVKTIPVDTFKLQRSTPPSPPPPPPRRRRTTRKLPKPDPEQEPPRSPPPPRAPPPPPPPPPPTPPRDPKRHQRKKSVGGAKDFASALAQFYQKKRKKSSSRSKASPDGAASPPSAGGGPPPPPPPPPPPSSVFNKLFTHKKSGSKAKRVHTVPPPPPPPPQRSKTQFSQHSSPLPPTSPHSVRRRRDRPSQANSNLKSPPTPPPPPPPPPSAATSVASATGEQGRLSCPPSPDVNNKADMFIARFRAGLELEKQNSIRAKEGQAAPPTDDEEEMVIGTLFDD